MSPRTVIEAIRIFDANDLQTILTMIEHANGAVRAAAQLAYNAKCHTAVYGNADVVWTDAMGEVVR